MYTPNYDETGRFIGVNSQDGRTIPNDPLNMDWQAFLDWNSIQANPISLANITPPYRPKPRPLTDIVADIKRLSSTDQNKLLLQVAARLLQDNPTLATDLGINVPGAS
jgi:hypothetical protein